MMKITLKRLLIAAACELIIAGCTNLPNMLAEGARGFCKHNPGDGLCVRQAPGNSDHAPPR